MPRAPVFTLPRLDRLGDRLAADVARDRPRYRHQLSGGQRQRVMIAMAVALAPKLIVADEPTTALDVTQQAQILTLSDAPRRRHGTALLFITHDVGVVAELADRVAVLQHRILVEAGRAEDALSAAAHDYTRALLSAVPGGPAQAGHGKPLSPVPSRAGAEAPSASRRERVIVSPVS